ncbi:dUTP diphosphatase [bacterium]|nr:dUTP diphosphatase [bacterium]
MTFRIAIKRLPHAPAELPEYASESAAGLDLRVATDSPVTINSGERTTIPTGFAIAIPEGFEGQIRMRSGIALEKGLLLPNAPATIDADYRGELKVIVANISHIKAQLQPGERFAQLVISPVAHIQWQEMTDLPASNRGDAGFGSTGRS